MNPILKSDLRSEQVMNIQKEMAQYLQHYAEDEAFSWQQHLWQLFYQCLPESWHDEVIPSWFQGQTAGKALPWVIYAQSAATAHRFHFMSMEVVRRLQTLLRQERQYASYARVMLQGRLQLKVVQRPDLWAARKKIPTAHLECLLKPQPLDDAAADAILDAFLN